MLRILVLSTHVEYLTGSLSFLSTHLEYDTLHAVLSRSNNFSLALFRLIGWGNQRILLAFSRPSACPNLNTANNSFEDAAMARVVILFRAFTYPGQGTKFDSCRMKVVLNYVRESTSQPPPPDLAVVSTLDDI